MSNFDSINISTSKELLLSKEETGVETFLRSALYSGLQVPITGAAQLVDKVTGSNVLPKLQFVAAPKHDSVVASVAASVGAITATSAHLLLMLSLGHKIAESEILQQNLKYNCSFAHRAAVTGVLGAFYGGVLTPVQAGGDFGSDRFKNMLRGTAGLAGMSACSSFYKNVSVMDKEMSFPGLKIMPGSLFGIALVVDTAGCVPQDNYTVFLPMAKLKPAEQFFLQPNQKR